MDILELVQALSTGRFDDLIGCVEDDHVDFKEQPYQTATEKGKYALLEDVSAFANHEGGAIVLGCRTKSGDLEGDIVEEIRPVPREQLDFETYRSLLNAHIHPQVKGITFSFFPITEGSDKGLGAIEIPVGATSDKPHLIAHVISEDSGRKNTTKYALVTRTGARNSPYPVATIHGLIKIGTSVGSLDASVRNIERRLAEIMAQNELAVKADDQIPLDSNRKSFLRSLPGLLDATGFAGVPALVLAAFPSERVECRGIYDNSSDISSAFDNPPELRQSGFDLSISGYAEIVEGTARRKVAMGYKVTQLTVSGRLTAVVRADEDFLAWAQNRQPGKPIHYRSWILTEVTFLFEIG